MLRDFALNNDFVVCLAAETTQSSTNYRRVFHDEKLNTLSKGQFQDTASALDLSKLADFQKSQGENLPQLVHLDWTICSVKDFKVLEVCSVYVKPDKAIDEATAKHTGLDQALITREGITFSDAIGKFKQSLANTVGDKSHKILTTGDWLTKYQLPLDSLRTGTSTEGLFDDKKSINLLDLHYELQADKPVKDLSELMRLNELEAITGPARAKTDCQSIVRLVNRLIRQARAFESEKTGAAATISNSNESTEESKVTAVDETSTRRRSRSRSSEATNQGTTAGGASKPVEFQDSDNVALKLRGIPFQGQVSDVQTFFQKWNVEEDRIDMIMKDDGRFSGVAFVLLNSEAEAAEALNEMQGQNIGHRWIEIFPITYTQYLNKSAGGRDSSRGGGGNQGPQEDILLSKFLNPGNVNKACKLGGLPFRVKPEEIQEFFKDFNVSESDIVIEQKDGRRSGYGLVFLQSEEQVDEAISTLHRQYIGQRFVNVW